MARRVASYTLACAALIGGAGLCAAAELPERLVGHGGPIKAISVSPDGLQALTASFDYAVILWTLEGAEGMVEQRMIGHDAAVNDVAFVPGVPEAVSVGDDGALIHWDLETGEVLHRADGGDDKVLDVDVSPDGVLAASARWDETARLHHLATGAEIARLEGHRGNINAVVFSPDSSRVYTGSYDGTVREWTVPDGEYQRTLASHGWGINALSVSPDGTELTFGALDGFVGRVALDDSRAQSELAQFDRPVLSMTKSRDGQLLAVGVADGTVHVYDAATGEEQETNIASFGPIWDVAFMPDGNRLFHVGMDDFAVLWQVNPRLPFDPVQSEFPRRFQVIETGDPGENEFARKCSVCHTLTPDAANRAGPTLYGLFGRLAGTVEDYAYSNALIESDIVWTADTVSWLFDDGPDVVTPGTKMPIQRLKSVDRRDALIAFLERATKPDGTNPPPGIMKTQ